MKNKKNCKKRKKNDLITPLGMFYYYSFGMVSKVWQKIFKVSLKKTDEFCEAEKKPMLLLANHVSTFDIMTIMLGLYPYKQNFVVAEQMKYRSFAHAHVLKNFGAIYKKQFYSDFSCVRNIKKNLDAGIHVVVCPEGKVSDDGITQPIGFSNAKLIKWLGYPVGVLVNHGGGLSKPKWGGKGFRKGKIELECKMILTSEQTKSMNNDEIFELVQKELYNNEHKYQVENGIKFKFAKPADGLDKILYKCPKCQEEFEIVSDGNFLTCKKCGNKVQYDEYGKITPVGDAVSFSRIDVWRDFERKSVCKELNKENFLLQTEVEHFVADEKNKNRMKLFDCGKLTMDKENITYRSETNELVFSLDNMLSIASMPKESITLYLEGKMHKFKIVGKVSSSKFTIAVEELGKIKNFNVKA